MMQLLPIGEGDKDKKDEKKELTPLTFLKQPIQPPSAPISAPKGFYVFAYKMINEPDGGKTYFVVSDHTDIEKFINERLKFGELTRDIKIIEKADDFLQAQHIATILTLEANEEGGIRKFRLGGFLDSKYTWREIFNKETRIKKYGF